MFAAQRRPRGGYRVWYAIADVVSFVAAGGALDREVRVRGVTLHQPDRRTPLYPEALGQGAASLLPGEDRCPSPSPSQSLVSVSCVSADFCLAVGEGGVARWDGRAWSRTGGPPSLALGPVDCVSPTYCLATSARTSGPLVSPVYRWDGRTWTPESAPAGLHQSVTCWAVDRCLLGGTAGPLTEGGGAPVVVVKTARGWVTTVLEPGQRGNGRFLAAACHSGRCVAVAAYSGASFVFRSTDPVAGRWERIDRTLPPPPGAAAGVGCRPTSCHVVGRREDQPWAMRYGFG